MIEVDNSSGSLLDAVEEEEKRLDDEIDEAQQLDVEKEETLTSDKTNGTEYQEEKETEKQQEDALRRDLYYKIGDIKELQKRRKFYRNRRDKLNKEVNELFQKSNELKDKRDQLNEKVQKNKRLRDKKNKQAEDANDPKKEKELKEEADWHHQEVISLARESQEYHDEMIKASKRAKLIQKNADMEHKKIVKITKKINNLSSKIDEIKYELDN